MGAAVFGTSGDTTGIAVGAAMVGVVEMDAGGAARGVAGGVGAGRAGARVLGAGRVTRPSSAAIQRLKVAMILASMPPFDSTMTRHPLNRQNDSVTAVS